MTLEESKKLEIGSVVVLNSGSPKMTVTNIEHNFITCKFWNDKEQKFSTITHDYGELKITE